jgi:hypothetical protein
MALLTVSVPLHEFVDLQRMPAGDIRARFGLSEACRPRLTALADPPGRVLVLVTCQVDVDVVATGQNG